MQIFCFWRKYCWRRRGLGGVERLEFCATGFARLSLVFGKPLLAGATLLVEKLRAEVGFDLRDIFYTVVALVALKAFIASAFAAAAYRLPESSVSLYIDRLLRVGRDRRQGLIKPAAGFSGAAIGAVCDLTQPLFLVSIVLTGIFFFFAESSRVQVVWGVVRPGSVAFILFFLIRALPLETWAQRSDQRG